MALADFNVFISSSISLVGSTPGIDVGLLMLILDSKTGSISAKEYNLFRDNNPKHAAL